MSVADHLHLIPGYDPVATAGDCVFDLELAQLRVDFFPECLKHVEGAKAGQPFVLEPWQQALVGNLFGWKRPDGTRRYRESFVYVPRKNGKTSLCAGLCLMTLFCDGEPGAQIYCAAAEREQAKLVWNPARVMIAQDEALSARARLFQHSIVMESTNSFLKPISADAHTKHGFNTHFAVIDELHAQPNRDLVDVLLTSTGSRRQPMIVHITTADFDRESICNEKYDYACKVRDGVIDDPSFLPVIYEASLDSDWTSPEVWAAANPNLGVSVSEEYLAHECKRAQETPAYENTFKRLHLNIKTQQDVRWIPIELWDSCQTEFAAADLRGRECFGGLDIGRSGDLTAFVLVFPNADGGVYVLPYFWVSQESAAKRTRKDRVPYEQWIKDGHILPTVGSATDYDTVVRDINELGNQFAIQKIAIDRGFDSGAISTNLMEKCGIDLVGFGQGFLSMACPTREMDDMLRNKTLRHNGNPVMRWMANNVAVETDAAGNLKPSKKKSTERIDGIVSLVMAIALNSEYVKYSSVYNEKGSLSL